MYVFRYFCVWEMSVSKIRHKLSLFLIYPMLKKRRKKEQKGNIIISDKNLYSKNVPESILFARGGKKSDASLKIVAGYP